MSRGLRRGYVFVSFAALLLFSVGFATGALAEEAAERRLRLNPDLDGFKGNQGIRVDPNTVSGISFVHPTQMDIGSVGGNFVAIGTYKGKGTDDPNPLPDCPNDYGFSWSIYVDGVLNGDYFCEPMDIDAFGAPSSPKFQISYGFCPSLGVNRWLLSFGGTLWKCQVAGSTTAIAAQAGLETRNTITDFNIDVKYQNLEINFTGSSTWGNFNGNDSVADPLYRHNKISGTAFNVFLPPLD